MHWKQPPRSGESAYDAISLVWTTRFARSIRLSCPFPRTPFIPKQRLQRLVNLFPAGQFVRYIGVGIFNTLFGYISFVVVLTLLNAILPAHLLYLTVILASILSTPLNITVAYLGYKFLVFRTKGNYLGEWLKCFAVYGTGMIPGLVALSALTRLLQSVIHHHAASLHVFLSTVERYLTGHPLILPSARRDRQTLWPAILLGPS